MNAGTLSKLSQVRHVRVKVAERELMQIRRRRQEMAARLEAQRTKLAEIEHAYNDLRRAQREGGLQTVAELSSAQNRYELLYRAARRQAQRLLETNRELEQVRQREAELRRAYDAKRRKSETIDDQVAAVSREARRRGERRLTEEMEETARCAQPGA